MPDTLNGSTQAHDYDNDSDGAAGGAAIRFAQVDTGPDFTHPDFLVV